MRHPEVWRGAGRGEDRCQQASPQTLGASWHFWRLKDCNCLFLSITCSKVTASILFINYTLTRFPNAPNSSPNTQTHAYASTVKPRLWPWLVVPLQSRNEIHKSTHWGGKKDPAVILLCFYWFYFSCLGASFEEFYLRHQSQINREHYQQNKLLLQTTMDKYVNAV